MVGDIMSAEQQFKRTKAIYWASGIVSICGIIFEVLFGALGSYILGDGVKQYTLTISLFLTGMGIGASISEKVTKRLILSFVWIEFMIGIIGGFSTLTMFGITAYLPDGTDALFLYTVILVIGALTGLELPILIRKANEIGVTLNKSAARVLFSDYAGGLIGGLLFVFLLKPQLGLVKTAFVVAIVNVATALWIVYLFREELPHVTLHRVTGGIFLIILIVGVFFGQEAAFSFEQRLYRDPIIYAKETPYQRIIVTKEQGDLRLYLNGSLQFSSTDEHRYHETLVHPAVAAADSPKNVLVLGGGDGLAVRELLKHEGVRAITVVDLDPQIVSLAMNNHDLVSLNKRAFFNEKVKVIHEDAFRFMEKAQGFYDIILVDLPDPNNESLNKLYTREFYSLLRNHLSPTGAMMVQATSPVFAPEVYWTIDETIQSAGLRTENLHVEIPSFGNWGFVLAGRKGINLDELEINADTTYLTTRLLSSLGTFGKDEDDLIERDGERLEWKPNTLTDPHLIDKYEKAWLNY